MISIPRPIPGTSIIKHFPPGYDIANKAADYVGDYDQNGDGSINVTDFDSEATRTEYDDAMFWGLGRVADPDFRRKPRERTYSIERLARLADLLGDGNGKATAAEIERVMSEYDTGDAYTRPSGTTANNGRLEGNEWWTFNGDLGEQRVNRFPIWYIDHLAGSSKKAVAKAGEKASPRASTPKQ